MPALFFALTAIEAGAVWLHRSFPTQDGPVQLYYADVLADLLRGGGTYGAYFRMNSHSPVYCFFNYALVLLGRVFLPLTSERVLVSLYVVGFSAGVWFLVRSVERRNDWLPFYLLPFAFHAYLYIGIYNYAFGIAPMLFAMGLWLRSGTGWTWRAWLAWLGLLAALCSMHPLALAFLGLFIAGHVAATFVGACLAAGRSIPERMRAGWGSIAQSLPAAAAALAVLLWVSTFSSSSPAGPATQAAAHTPAADRLRLLLQMVPLSPFLAPLYRFCLLLLVLLPVSLLLIGPARASWKHKPEAFAASFALGSTAAAALALFLLGPAWFFGAGFFADRMSVIFVVCGLAALAPLTLPLPLRRAAVAAAVCVLALTAAIRDRETAAIVHALTPIYDAKPPNEGGWGAIVSGAEAVDGLTFNPYYWAGAHYARAGKAVLLNTPWIYGRLAIFTPRVVHPWDGATPERMRRILSGGQPGAASRLGFVCGGKWDPGRREMAASGSLARDLGFVRVFESEVTYCDGRAAGQTAPGFTANTPGK